MPVLGVHRGLSNHYVRGNSTQLLAALQRDGFEWAEDRLIPTDQGAAPLAEEITALERELLQLGMNVASTHYRQAVETFGDGNFEACNGQLRSYLEDLIKGAASRRGLAQASGAGGSGISQGSQCQST